MGVHQLWQMVSPTGPGGQSERLRRIARRHNSGSVCERGGCLRAMRKEKTVFDARVAEKLTWAAVW